MVRGGWLLVLVLCVYNVRGQVSEMSLDPLLTFISCLRDVKPGFCIRERALGYFETWLSSAEDDENPASPDGEDEEEPGSRLNPYWKKMVDQVAERIAGYYGEDDDEEEGKAMIGEPLGQPSNKSALDARDKKYKKDKKVKVAMTIILLIIYFIISQLFYMFDKVARTAIFGKLVLAFKVFVIVKLIELKRYLWWVKEEKKDQVHHEVSHHDHVWDEPEHYDHHYGASYDHPHPHYDHPPWGGWHGRADPYATDPYRAHVPPTPPPSGR